MSGSRFMMIAANYCKTDAVSWRKASIAVDISDALGQCNPLRIYHGAAALVIYAAP
jgi:hypothetical protein